MREFSIHTRRWNDRQKMSLSGAPVYQSKTADLLVDNIAELLPLRSRDGLALRGSELGSLESISEAAIAIAEGRILAVGPGHELRERFPTAPRFDAERRVALPGFVDPHTHLPFYGRRENDFEARILGKTYAEIAREGGGIRSTVRQTRAASLEELVHAGRKRLNRMLLWGTTTAEAKSGYGLDLETERRQLQAIAKLDELQPVDLVATNLAAHEVPDEYRSDREAYIRRLCDEILPELAGLARFCDIFCEDHVFSVAESRRILERARELGYELKVHADELEALGGAELACELGAVSADHLGCISDQGIKDLAASSTIAVLLPGTSFYLNLAKRAPARRLIEAGAAVALATDLNPGSCLTESMPAILTIACTQLRMTPAEAIAATTLNAACAMGLGADRGSLEPGKLADFTLWDAPSWRYIPSHFGVNLIHSVFKRGQLVVHDGRLVSEPSHSLRASEA